MLQDLSVDHIIELIGVEGKFQTVGMDIGPCGLSVGSRHGDRIVGTPIDGCFPGFQYGLIGFDAATDVKDVSRYNLVFELQQHPQQSDSFQVQWFAATWIQEILHSGAGFI